MASSEAGYNAARRQNQRPRGSRRPYTKAGPVTVRRPDGQTEVLPSYGREKFDRLVQRRSTRTR